MRASVTKTSSVNSIRRWSVVALRSAPAAASEEDHTMEKMSRSYIPALQWAQCSKNSGECAMNCCFSGMCDCRMTFTHCSLRS